MAKLLESILYLTIIQECVMSVNPYKKKQTDMSLLFYPINAMIP
ncbi:hypothetical protein C2W59_03402 [Bacillus pumilus]|nr:hypothetical protein C2W59_03402 [Bacillus pumilus]